MDNIKTELEKTKELFKVANDSLRSLRKVIQVELKERESIKRINNFSEEGLKVIDEIVQSINIGVNRNRCGAECHWKHSTTDYYGRPETICILTGLDIDNDQRTHKCKKLTGE